MLTYASMPEEARRIANSNLGRGALKSVFTGNHDYQLILKVEDGVTIGFGIYHFEKITVAGKEAVQGVLDCLLIDERSRQLGHGSNLTYAIFKKMSVYGVSRVETLIKQPGYTDRDGEPGVPLATPGSILSALGFREVRTLRGYYSALSERIGYDCKFCGNVPDNCDAVLYSKEAL